MAFIVKNLGLKHHLLRQQYRALSLPGLVFDQVRLQGIALSRSRGRFRSAFASSV